MSKHKGIGVNEVSTSFSFYAPYTPGTENNSQPWGWFKTAQEAVKGTQNYARAWIMTMYLWDVACPFVRRRSLRSSRYGAGVLHSYISSGNALNDNGFRSVLVV